MKAIYPQPRLFKLQYTIVTFDREFFREVNILATSAKEAVKLLRDRTNLDESIEIIVKDVA